MDTKSSECRGGTDTEGSGESEGSEVKEVIEEVKVKESEVKKWSALFKEEHGQTEESDGSSSSGLPDLVAPDATSSPMKGRTKLQFGKFGSLSPVEGILRTHPEGIVIPNIFIKLIKVKLWSN